jgi:hypothetical protein
MSKKPGQWLLRFHPSLSGQQQPAAASVKQEDKKESSNASSASHNYPILAKFPDPVDWDHLAGKKPNSRNPIYMSYQEEQLKEDDADDLVIKDAEYYRRKSRNRSNRAYRKKKLLVFECPNENLYYEGKENSVDIGDGVVDRKQELQQSDSTAPDFQYVLFKFVKNSAEGNPAQEVPEIQVIPISSMFTLRKLGKLKDELLGEIEEKYVEEKKVLQKKLLKYKHIVTALQKDRNGEFIHNFDSNSGKGPMFLDDVSETDLFKQALNKAFGIRRTPGSSGKGGRSSGGGGRATVDMNESGPSDGNDEGGGGNRGVAINEGGIDMDELKEFSYCGGDYETRFADDEEDNVAMEQLGNNRMAEDEFARSFKDDENLSENDDDDEEDEEAAAAGVQQGGQGSGGGEERLGNTVGLVGSESGFINEQTLNLASQAVKQLGLQQEKQQLLQQQQQQQKANLPLKSALKRAREEAEENAARDEGDGNEEDENYGMTNDNEGLLLHQNTMNNTMLLPPSSTVSSSQQQQQQAANEAGEGGGKKKKAKISFADSSAAAEAAAKEAAAVMNPTASTTTSTTTSTTSAAAGMASGTSKKEYDLTEEGVKSYIQNRGGKVAIKEISEVKRKENEFHVNKEKQI